MSNSPAVPLSEERINELKRLAEAATPGPWSADLRESWDMVVWGPPNPAQADDEHDGSDLVVNIGETIVEVGSVSGSEADTLLIVAMRNALPALLSELSRLREDAARANICTANAYAKEVSRPRRGAGE